MSLANRTPPTDAEYAEYRTRYRTGASGATTTSSERSTTSLLTSAAPRPALVTEGRAVSMARPLDTHASPANPYPAHTFVALEGSGGMLDYVGCFVHGFTQTHIDALCHLRTAEGDTFWNGKPFGHSSMPQDHTGTIDFWRDGIVTARRPLRHPAPARRRVRRAGRAGARLGARGRGRGAGRRATGAATP